MVEDRLTDGTRIARLLASELHGREDGPLNRVTIVYARERIDPAGTGARASDVAVDGSIVARAGLLPERAAGAVLEAFETVVGAAESAGLRTRRESDGSGARSGPRAVVSVERGATCSEPSTP